MIKPSELPNLVTTPTQQATIEAHIDRAITRHVEARRPWPLVIPSTRAGWLEADVEAVLVRYRGAGWSAMTGGRTAMCVLSPNQAATANRTDEALSLALADHSAAVASAVEAGDLEPGWEDRAVQRARDEGVLP